MSTQALVMALCIGAAAIAPWIDHRFPKLAPPHVGYAFLHFLSAKCALHALPPALDATIARGGATWAMIGLFVFVVPVFVYTWLTWFWALKLMLDPFRRRFG